MPSFLSICKTNRFYIYSLYQLFYTFFSFPLFLSNQEQHNQHFVSHSLCKLSHCLLSLTYSQAVLYTSSVCLCLPLSPSLPVSLLKISHNIVCSLSFWLSLSLFLSANSLLITYFSNPSLYFTSLSPFLLPLYPLSISHTLSLSPHFLSSPSLTSVSISHFLLSLFISLSPSPLPLSCGWWCHVATWRLADYFKRWCKQSLFHQKKDNNWASHLQSNNDLICPKKNLSDSQNVELEKSENWRRLSDAFWRSGQNFFFRPCWRTDQLRWSVCLWQSFISG